MAEPNEQPARVARVSERVRLGLFCGVVVAVFVLFDALLLMLGPVR